LKIEAPNKRKRYQKEKEEKRTIKKKERREGE